MVRFKRILLFIYIVVSYGFAKLMEIIDRLAQHNLAANRWMKRKLTFGWRTRLLINSMSLLMTASILILLFAVHSMPDWDETDQIWNIKRQHSITFLDRHGEILGYRGGAMDTSLELKDYPPHLVRTVLAVEDQRFYSHWGLDPIGIVAALIHNITNPHAREKGGSTITQQVVKNIWLTPERTFKRKITEAWLALWLENHATKDEILKLYFERAYMGAGNYGLAAASQYYFGKPVTEVTVPEAAMLAGLFKAPVSYSPSYNFDDSLERMHVVLGIMRDADLIDDATFIWAMEHDPRIKKIDRLPSEWALDYAYIEAIRLINNRGLAGYRNFTIKTTLDSYMQNHANDVIKNMVATRGPEFDVSQASLVSMGVDGSVRALVGGVDYQTNQFNRAISAKRQPGSAFKPLVYLTALMGGWKPDTRVVDSPVTLTVFGKQWTPSNYDDRYFGEITLREALQRSLNTVAIKIMMKFGRQNIVDVAHLAGIRSELKTVASLPLGSNEVTLLELTGAYTTFASGGQHQTPWVINSIEAGGRQVYTHLDEVNHNMTFPKDTIVNMVEMLHSVVERGTATKAKLAVPVAGKTGTTSDYNDAWFIGFTGNHVTGVWFGNDDNTKMNKLTGGNLPAQAWHDYMVVAETKSMPRDIPGIDSRPPTLLEPGELAAKRTKPPKKAAPAEVVKETVEQPTPMESKEPNFFEKLFGIISQ
jgi:penicillin-binding protein 1A